MNEIEIKQLLDVQRVYFETGATLNVDKRLDHLKKLKKTINQFEPEIIAALKADLNKSPTESYMCEIGMVYSELDYMLKHTRQFAKKRRVRTPLAQAIATSYVLPSPFGVTLILSPWNYPFMLSIDPLIDALSAGNTVIIKPSAYAPNTSHIIKKIIEETFPRELVAVIEGGRAENTALLAQNFDYIFFTGSKNVGKEVLRQAANHLTPVTLELGGKSPCIIDQSADLKMAAKRIVFGKFLNAGQTCVAPDYLLCHKTKVSELLSLLKQEIKVQYGNNPLNNPDLCKIINQKHFNRLNDLLTASQIYEGGQTNPETLQIAPTIIYPCAKDAKVMQEEIFGPLLPIITYEDLNEVIKEVNQGETPLALYFFASDQKTIDYVLSHAHFGGASIDETIMHLATPYMGFGGLKESGMGAYHGKTGFDTFTHYKSVIAKKTWFDLSVRYQPYTKFKDRIIKLFMH